MTNDFVGISENIDQERVSSMSDDNSSETKPEPDKGSQSVVAGAFKVLGNAEFVKDSKRQVVDGALIGTCLVFFAAMLGVQKLDGALTTALVTFVIAIPILVYGFLFSSFKAKLVEGWLLLVGLQMGAWIIEALGWLAVAIGVVAIIKHLSPVAFAALIITSICVVVIGFIGSFIGLMIYAVHKFGGKKQKQALAQEAKQ